jgi:protein-L-isoaspartate(D-aspartate) O-methyltransferase
MNGKQKIIISIAVILALVIIITLVVLYKNRDMDQGGYEELREKMVENQIIERGIRDPDVIEAMKKVPRHDFVDEDQKSHAYEDRPLPIGLGQTISQPYIVSLMTEQLQLDGDERVLEVGTGSGYQAAVLSEITEDVYTVEIIPDLYEKAEKRLEEMYPEVMVSNHDGYYGWEEYAPFDRIIVTAAPDHIPQPLINQLKENGIMVIPVGPPGWSQVLWKVLRENGEVITEKIADVAFVPLTRED